jgi:tetratricopeptide (TPR) repeat protein
MKVTYALKNHDDYIGAIKECVKTNRIDIAHQLCSEAILLFPESFRINFYFASVLLKKNERENAQHYGLKAVQIYNARKITAEDVQYTNDLGILFSKMKNYAVAQTCFAEYIKFNPKDPSGFNNMGQALFEQNNFAEALEWFEKAEKLGVSYHVISNIGMCLTNLRRLDRAEIYFRKAMELKPGDWNPYYNLGIIKQHKNIEDQAIDYFKQSIKVCPDSGMAYNAMSSIISFLKNKENCNEAIGEINLLLQKPGLEKTAIYNLNYALGNIYNAQKQYDKAFAHYSAANDLKKNYCTFDIAKYPVAMQRFSAVFTKELIDKFKPFGNDSSIPAFIIGMPRSGTTLVEQIIISHTDVYSVGETQNVGALTASIRVKEIPEKTGYPEVVKYFSSEDIEILSNKYLDIIKEDHKNALKIFDKMPENSFNIGLIKILFPNAIIINCKRHPLDVVISMFANNFEKKTFPNKLEDIAGYYKYYNEIMKHWHSVFPGQIYDNYYEELVCRQYEKSQELIKKCGLDWEDSCLNFYKNNIPVFTASHSQVKEPMYSSSVFRWKNYESYLGPVKEIIKDEIAEYEAEIIKRVPELVERL